LKVVLLPQARQDLEPVVDPLFSEIVRRLETLRDYPEMGAAMVGPFSGYRSTVVGPFRIVYRLARESVEVAYVRDCRREPLG
jgi:plasmid stabilization system protein ParE